MDLPPPNRPSPPSSDPRRTDKLLARRTERLAREVNPEEDARAEVEWLTFWVSRQLFGVPLASAQGVLRLEKLVALPGAPSYISGLVRVAHRFIVLIDMRELLVPDGRGIADVNKVVAVRIADQVLGLAVSDLHDVVPLAEAQFAAARLSDDGLSRAVTISGEPLALLDLGALTRDVRLTRFLKLDRAATYSSSRKD
jgi:chemotaxis signal transduction protein